jgi:hypothetical protein
MIMHFLCPTRMLSRRGNVVGIGRDWLRAGRLRGRISSSGRVKKFIFSKSSRPALGSTQLFIQWVPEALSPEVKQLKREDDHSPPSSTEVKIMWIYTFTPP